MYNFRISKSPQRTCLKVFDHYKKYKSYLASDFNNRCGYCDAHHAWFAGSRFYHIDHFAPKSKFKELEHSYRNLVYACPFCNLSKSDDWPANHQDVSVDAGKGYIDPCSNEYNSLFSRNNCGEIVPNTDIAKYMYKKLKFYLIRHSAIWNLTRLYMLLQEIHKLLDTKSLPCTDKIKLERHKNELHDYFFKYLREYMGNIQ